MESADGPAIRALGPLFKLTQVFLWDDGSTTLSEDYSLKEKLDDDSLLDGLSTAPDYNPRSEEDLELISQMNVLGLPLSFQTNKEKRNPVSKGKRKGTQMKCSGGCVDVDSEAMELAEVSVEETVSPVFHGDNNSSLGQHEECICDIAVDAGRSQSFSVEGDVSVSSIRITSDAYAVEDQICNGTHHTAEKFVRDSESIQGDIVLNNNGETVENSTTLDGGLSLERYLTDAGSDRNKKENVEKIDVNECLMGSPMLHNDVEVGNRASLSYGSYESSWPCKGSVQEEANFVEGEDDSGHWMVYLDDFYMRNYFYNTKTHVSTWLPPPGMDHLACGDITCKLHEDVSPAKEARDISSLHCITGSVDESMDVDKLVGRQRDELATEKETRAENILSDMTVLTLCGISEQINGEINGYYNANHEPEDCGSNGMQLAKDERAGELDCFDVPQTYDEDEALTSIHSSCLNQTLIRSVSDENDMNVDLMTLNTEKLDAHLHSTTKKQKKKSRRRRLFRKSTFDSQDFLPQGILEACSADISKYWRQRYLLFSKFDDGIMMDEEGWFSVTPEALARHHALRCGGGIVIDCFTGVGGNAIQFAKRSKHVIAIDIDARKVDYAHHNAAIYGVSDSIDFIKGDSLQLIPKMKADTVFLSPPWGGPDYAKVKSYDINTMLRPRDGYFIFNLARKIVSKVIMFLPKNVDINQLAELALSAQPPWSLEVERNFLNGKLKAVTAYFDDTSAMDIR